MRTTDLMKPSSVRPQPRSDPHSSAAQMPPDRFSSSAPAADLVKLDIATQVLAVLALFAVLKLHLLSALLSGLLIYALVTAIAQKSDSVIEIPWTSKVAAL